jgi:hypothetical protein
MRKDHTLGTVLPTLFFLAGTYLLYGSTAHSQWYMDIYLIAGATITAIGLMTGFWAIKQHLPIRRRENHARGHQQIEPRQSS